jgi:hypothetical protein
MLSSSMVSFSMQSDSLFEVQPPRRRRRFDADERGSASFWLAGLPDLR